MITQWSTFNLALNRSVYVPDYQTFRIIKLVTMLMQVLRVIASDNAHFSDFHFFITE